MGRKPKILEPKRKVRRKKLKKNLLSLEGLFDILPDDMVYLKKIDSVIRNIANYYDFREIRLPIIENSSVFDYSFGKNSSILKNEIYKFKMFGEELSLRPDFVSGIVRSYIQNKINWGFPVKIFTEGPIFRHKLKKEKKHIQSWQYSFNILGDNNPIYDSLIIQALYNCLTDLKINDLILEVNANGCDTCRPNWNIIIGRYFSSKQKRTCSNCKKLPKNEVYKILCCENGDCKEISEQAPKILDNLCSNCCKHFMVVMEYLESIQLPFNISNRLISPFEYYNQTLFRIIDSKKGLCLAEGGRHNHLIEVLGGKSKSGMSGSLNIDEILRIMKSKDNSKKKKDIPLIDKNRVFLVLLGELAKKKGLILLESLRKSGISVSESFGNDSLKNQILQAENRDIPLLVIIGQKEIADNTAIVKDRKMGFQEIIPFEKLSENLKKRIKSVKM
jgi:histidyl-tRNA synthetase